MVSPVLVFALRSSFVDYHEDLPTHAVLVAEFDRPASNPRVLKCRSHWTKWPLMRPSLNVFGMKLERWHVAVDQPLENGHSDEAFANWSEIVEAILLSSVDGEA